MEDGSVMAVTLDQDLDKDGDILVVSYIHASDLLTAVMKASLINKLYRICFETGVHYEAYLVRLKDDSVLVSTGNPFFVSNWLTVNNENLVCHGAPHIATTKLTFKHLLEPEYTFL